MAVNHKKCGKSYLAAGTLTEIHDKEAFDKKRYNSWDIAGSPTATPTCASSKVSVWDENTSAPGQNQRSNPVFPQNVPSFSESEQETQHCFCCLSCLLSKPAGSANISGQFSFNDIKMLKYIFVNRHIFVKICDFKSSSLNRKLGVLTKSSTNLWL